MNIPQFNAEASLGPAAGMYHGKTGYSRPNSTQVLLSQNLRMRFPGRTMTCCRNGRCRTQIIHPLEICECSTDFYGGPLILCFTVDENAPPR